MTLDSTVVRLENGSHLPNSAMITYLSGVLDADIGTLLSATTRSDESPNIIIVDDSKIILYDSLPVLEEFFPMTARFI